MTKRENFKNGKGRQRKLLAFLNEEVESLIRKNKLGLAENYLSSGRSLQGYLGAVQKRDISLRKVDEEFLMGYQHWLLDRGVVRNTAVFYMRNLHAVYNKAVAQRLVPDTRPFVRVQTNITHTEKRAVTPDLIRNICALDIRAGLVELGQDPTKKPFVRMCRELTFARDTFIFCFCARGLTFVDFAYLKPGDIRRGSIVYDHRKTEQHIEVEILPQMRDFIEAYGALEGPYLFPVLTSTDVTEAHRQYNTALRRYNKHLKKISRMLGLDVSLTSYVSRHSWATAAYHADMPMPYISEAMGHTSENTTRIYLKSLDNSEIDKENKRLLDGIFKLTLF